jgi:hypothetical protein
MVAPFKVNDHSVSAGSPVSVNVTLFLPRRRRASKSAATNAAAKAPMTGYTNGGGAAPEPEVGEEGLTVTVAFADARAGTAELSVTTTQYVVMAVNAEVV